MLISHIIKHNINIYFGENFTTNCEKVTILREVKLWKEIPKLEKKK